jgi:hypothetical protein
MRHLPGKLFSRLLSLLVGGLLATALFSAPAEAASEFATSYRIDYAVRQNGQVEVDQAITLSNRLANIYATQYSVVIGSTKLTNISAWDQFGALKPKVEVGDNRTQISFSFPEKVVGKGASRQFHVTYTTADFAQIKGRVLEIGIPLLADIEELADYHVQLHVPESFDKANYFLPTPHEVYTSGSQRHYQFTKENLIGLEGITGTFGEYQLFAFSLKYHLDNQDNRPVLTQVALPADTAFQELAYTKLEPPPQDVEADDDGNWLATYRLEKDQAIEVSVQGVAKILLTPQSMAKPLASETRAAYLAAQTYWPVDDSRIRGLADQLKTPEAIYDFLVANFQYDYDRLTETAQRKGALWALDHPKELICMEFTDLFITLARAAGIPAREANGFAYTTNSKLRPLSLEQDVLHAWPEYYDDQAQVWIPVDPTWGNTTGGLDFFRKLDLDHFTFIERGLDSTQPLPAGSYKLADTAGKDVMIEFASAFPDPEQPKITLELPEARFAGWPIDGFALVKNPGPYALKQTTGTLRVLHEGKAVLNTEFTLPNLPPGSQETVPLHWPTSPWDRKSQYQIQLTLGEQTQTASLLVKPLITPLTLAALGAGLLLFGLAVWLTIVRPWLFHRKLPKK